MSNFRKFISMSAVAILAGTNLLAPLSYASAQTDLGNFDSITFPVTAKSFRFVMPAHDVFLYAVTEANKYFVEYYGHGSTTWSLYTWEQTYDTTWDLLDNRYEKLWYSFKEWNREEGWTGAGYPESATNVVDNWTDVQSGVVPVYAQWDPNRYNIHYDLSDGTGTSSWVHAKEPTSWKYDEELTIPNASRTWYTFSGWYITGMDENPHIIGWAPYNGETKDHEDATSYSQLRADTGDVYFAARWDPNTNTKYEVRHFLQNFNGLYDTGTNYKDHNEETWTTDTDVQPGVNHYEWYDDATPYTGNINADGSTVFFYHYPRQSHTLTLHAGRWISTVTATGQYNTAGITTNDTASTGFMYEEPIVLSYTIKNWYTWATWSWYLDESSSFTMTGQNIEKTAYADVIEYTVTYDDKWANIHTPVNPTTYTVESGFTISDAPDRSNSVFSWWIGSNGDTPHKVVTVATGTYWNLSYTAVYDCDPWYKQNSGNTACIPRDDIEYFVRHLQADLSGWYTVVDEDTMTGTTEQMTKAKHNVYEWFTHEEYHNVVISWGTTIKIDIKYQRNTNTITMVDATGTTEWFSGQYSTAPNYKYGDTITLTHSEDDGYTWSGWTVTYTSGTDTINVDLDGNTFTMPDGPVTITPHVTIDDYTITYVLHNWTLPEWVANPTHYTVESGAITLPTPTRDNGNSHFDWWKGISGTAEPASADPSYELPAGSIGNKTYEAVWSCNPWYHDSGDDHCVANQYTVQIDYKDGGNGGETNTGSVTFTYDDPTTIPNPQQSWYTFAWWTISWLSSGATVDNNPLNTPSDNGVTGTAFNNLTTTSWGTVTFVANWTPDPDTQYVVHYYVKDLTGNTYTLTGTYTWAKETNTGITLADEAARSTYSWFTYSSWYVNAGDTTRPTAGDVLETTVDKHGNTVINLYYDRDKYHVYLAGDANVDPTGFTWEGDYFYGEDVTVDMTAKTWYHFVRWQKKNSLSELWIED